MSAEAIALPAADLSSARDTRVLRYAFGVTLAMTISVAFTWDLAFLTPILLNGFLGAPKPRPSLAAGASFVLVTTIATVLATWTTKHVHAYPGVFSLVTLLVLFRVMVAKERGASPLLVTFLLITFTVIPLVGGGSPQAGRYVAQGMILNAVLTIALTWLAFGLLPDPPGAFDDVAASPPPKAAAPDAGEVLRSALTGTVVVFPLFLAFHLFQWTSGALILAFVVILSQQPSGAVNAKVGKALILGNTLGGLASIVAYELLTVAPQLPFLFLLMFFLGLVVGRRAFSGSPSAALWTMGLSTLMLVLGTTTGSGGTGAGEKVAVRIVQIVAAVVYVVVAFGWIERLRGARGARRA